MILSASGFSAESLGLYFLNGMGDHDQFYNTDSVDSCAFISANTNINRNLYMRNAFILSQESFCVCYSTTTEWMTELCMQRPYANNGNNKIC